MKNFVFDIETVALDTDTLRAAMPAFDPESVKTGNMGPEKAAEKIEKARNEYFERFFRRAALSALTGQIAMIGIRHQDGTKQILEGAEPEMISAWFKMFESNVEKGGHWIGFCIQNFDVPFIIRRGWLHGIKVPYGLSRGRYLTGFFTDLLELWTGSDRGASYGEISLNILANYFGLGQKTANGANFGELLRYDPAKARAYLETDLELTWAVAERMGALRWPLAEILKPEADGVKGAVKSCPGAVGIRPTELSPIEFF